MTETKQEIAWAIGNLLNIEISTSNGSTITKQSWLNILLALGEKELTKHEIAKAVGVILDVEIPVSSEGTVIKEAWENVYHALKNKY